MNIVSEPPRRERLRHINSINDAVRLLRSCKKILVLTGAGVRYFIFSFFLNTIINVRLFTIRCLCLVASQISAVAMEFMLV